MIKITKEQEALFNQAIKSYGEYFQIMMCIEECAELTQSLTHFLRNRVSPDKVAEEIADVFIMANQMRIVFGKGLVDQHIREKMDRLESMIKEN